MDDLLRLQPSQFLAKRTPSCGSPGGKGILSHENAFQAPEVPYENRQVFAEEPLRIWSPHFQDQRNKKRRTMRKSVNSALLPQDGRFFRKIKGCQKQINQTTKELKKHGRNLQVSRTGTIRFPEGKPTKQTGTWNSGRRGWGSSSTPPNPPMFESLPRVVHSFPCWVVSTYFLLYRSRRHMDVDTCLSSTSLMCKLARYQGTPWGGLQQSPPCKDAHHLLDSYCRVSLSNAEVRVQFLRTNE